MSENKTMLQALTLINDCNKYKMDLTTNGVVITVLFEKMINAVHQTAPPSSKICFNTNPGDTAEAVPRWVGS
jgi:hypothetical protein